MSGGHFDYVQHTLSDTIDKLYRILEDQELVKVRSNECYGSEDCQCPECYYIEEFSRETIKEIKKTLDLTQMTQLYLNRVDWLISGDDDEDTFHERILSDLLSLRNSTKFGDKK